MAPAKKAAEVARQPVIYLSGTAIVAILGFLGFKSGVTNAAEKASEKPNANLIIIANTVEQMRTQNDKNFERLNDGFDKIIELYTENHSEIGILKTRVGHNEDDIKDHDSRLRGVEHRAYDPIGGDD